MFRIILASIWIFAAIATLVLGLNGSIDPAAMVAFSLVALALFYAFALRTVIANTRESPTQRVKQ
jgi:quinol-cytochrome oxidoreductase complex cytochrome b subunit